MENCSIINVSAQESAAEPPVDRRIQRTRQLLREALFSLVIERGYTEIGIQDITERANLGRTTFYLHYQTKDDLLKTGLKTLLQNLQLEVEPSPDEVCPFLDRCVRIFQHVSQRRRLYQALLRETGPVNTGNILRSYFVELFRRYARQIEGMARLPQPTADIVVANAAGALLGMIGWWLNEAGDPPPNPTDMGTLYFKLMAQGASHLVETL
jgi:AcrR family transcriptional regulator